MCMILFGPSATFRTTKFPKRMSIPLRQPITLRPRKFRQHPAYRSCRASCRKSSESDLRRHIQTHKANAKALELTQSSSRSPSYDSVIVPQNSLNCALRCRKTLSIRTYSASAAAAFFGSTGSSSPFRRGDSVASSSPICVSASRSDASRAALLGAARSELNEACSSLSSIFRAAISFFVSVAAF